jgi:hypothetical protein
MVDVRHVRSTNQPVKRLNEEDAMTVTAMPDAAHGCGWRHRVVAIGSGLVGLTATKALKHDPVNIADALVFLTRITAQGTAHVHNRTSLWLQVIPTTAAVLTTIGVLITLYITIVGGRKRAPRDGGSHQTQMDALHRTAGRFHETVTAARYLNRLGRLWRSRRTSKGWC